jgi:hypothetical protein
MELRVDTLVRVPARMTDSLLLQGVLVPLLVALKQRQHLRSTGVLLLVLLMMFRVLLVLL